MIWIMYPDGYEYSGCSSPPAYCVSPVKSRALGAAWSNDENIDYVMSNYFHYFVQFGQSPAHAKWCRCYVPVAAAAGLLVSTFATAPCARCNRPA